IFVAYTCLPLFCLTRILFPPPALLFPYTTLFRSSVADAAFLHDITPRSTPARIGVLKQPLFANTRVDPRHLRAVDEAAAHLSAAGYPVAAIEPYPIADVTFESFRHIFTSRLAGMAAGEGYFEWVRQQGLK